MSSSPNESRIRERFLADHVQLEELLEEVLRAFEADDRERIASLWNQFDARLLAHLAAEEKYMIPPLLRVDPPGARAILEEHEHIRARLTELGAGVDLHIVRLGTARAFIDELRAHANHEDKVLYQWADAHLGESDRATLLRALVDSVVHGSRGRFGGGRDESGDARSAEGQARRLLLAASEDTRSK
jgi:hemerythrin superfamily protein